MFSDERLPDLPLGVLATRLPGAASVLRRCGIAACDGPQRPLCEAAAESAVALPAILGALQDLAGAARAASSWTTEELIEHIVGRYHQRHRSDLLLLRRLAAELEGAATVRPERSEGLGDLIRALGFSLEEHMLKEELRVFPLIRLGRRDRLPDWFELLEREHEDSVHFLLRIEAVTDGYRPKGPEQGLWIRFYGELERFCEEIVAHLFLEEQVLFPRFMA
jgi:regulator of cell morphogenesis and NO signaling